MNITGCIAGFEKIWEEVMKGFLFRLGVKIKETGEWMASVPVLWLFCGAVIRLGIAIRESVLQNSVIKDLA